MAIGYFVEDSHPAEVRDIVIYHLSLTRDFQDCKIRISQKNINFHHCNGRNIMPLGY
jgi:hypothetical protein